ncbi:MAG: BMP family ABC transporter substrate-binding protein, partial [Anaeromyxobacteraceae bacterium]
YEKAFKDALEKTWKPEVTKWGVKEGMTDFVKVAEFLPEEVKKAVADAKEGLKNGTISVFKGPLVDNGGKEVLAKDAPADDKWRGEIAFYVKGVEGKVPSGK